MFLHPLPRDYSAADLRRAAHRAGILTITDAWIPRRQLGQPYGYLRFGCREDAVAALDALQQLDVGTHPSAMLGRPKSRHPVHCDEGNFLPSVGVGASPCGGVWGPPLTPWSYDGWEPALAPWPGDLPGDSSSLPYLAAMDETPCSGGYDASPYMATDPPSLYMPLLGAAGYPAPGLSPGCPWAGCWAAGDTAPAPGPDAHPDRRRHLAPACSRPRSAPPPGRCAGPTLALPEPGGSHSQTADPLPCGGLTLDSTARPGDPAAAEQDARCVCPAEREWVFLGLTISAAPREGDSRRLLAGMLAATRRLASGYRA